MQAILQKSTRKDKRYMVLLDTPTGAHLIHFGSPAHENYTTHKDAKRRELYLARHAKRENWEDPTTAGFWSRWLLWEAPHMLDAIQSLKKKGITVRISKH